MDNVIQINVANTVSIVLMGALGYGLLQLVAKVMNWQQPGAMQQ